MLQFQTLGEAATILTFCKVGESIASHPPDGHRLSNNQINHCLPLNILMQQVDLVKENSLDILQFWSPCPLRTGLPTYLVPLMFKCRVFKPPGYASIMKQSKMFCDPLKLLDV